MSLIKIFFLFLHIFYRLVVQVFLSSSIFLFLHYVFDVAVL